MASPAQVLTRFLVRVFIVFTFVNLCARLFTNHILLFHLYACLTPSLFSIWCYSRFPFAWPSRDIFISLPSRLSLPIWNSACFASRHGPSHLHPCRATKVGGGRFDFSCSSAAICSHQFHKRSWSSLAATPKMYGPLRTVQPDRFS